LSSLLESKYGSSGAGFLSQSSDGKMSGAGLTKGVDGKILSTSQNP
jgi:hypothetical protein